jgi:hypothetical protein
MNHKHHSITIEQPAPGRYVITGFPAASVYIEDVGTLAPPPNIDLPMSDDLAEAILAIINNWKPVPVVAMKPEIAASLTEADPGEWPPELIPARRGRKPKGGQE